MVFRFKPEGRAVFMSASTIQPLGRPPFAPPQYWQDEGCKQGTVGHKLIPGTQEELTWFQELLDKTFKAKSTRDRKEKLADRFVAVQCLRSEHPALWDKFAQRRRELASGPRADDSVAPPKTMQVAALAERCKDEQGRNLSNQAYLLHGTNPTSAVAILGNSFTVDFAGKSAGTMFGPGIYLAESSAKADEYAGDDVGGEYDGLFAMLICRASLGKAFVVEKAGDFRSEVLSGAHGHVLGDREKAVGTFREFILFHEGAVYPEYAIFYRRECEGQVLPRTAAASAPPQETMAD